MENLTNENMSARRRAHKWARTHAQSEQWRERLLKNCLQRMQDTRATTMDERRRVRMQIVAEETVRLREGQVISSKDDQAELVALLEEESDSNLQHLLDSLVRDTDEDVVELVTVQESMAQDDVVLCPVCCKGRLLVSAGDIGCSCGLHVDCGTCDNVTLPMVSERLAQVVKEHNASCASKLGFGVRNTFGTFLWACCATCRFDCVVL